MALLLDDERGQAVASAGLLSRISGPGARVIRADARLRSLLAFERAPAPDGQASRESDARSLARALTERQGDETQIILLMERAETLTRATLRSLQAMAPYFTHPGRPTLQVVFIGRPAFRALLAGAELTPLRVALGFEGSLPGHEAVPAEAASTPEPAGKRRKALVIYPVATIALSAVVAGAAYLGVSRPPDRETPAATPPPTPSAAPPISSPSSPPPSTVPAPTRAAMAPLATKATEEDQAAQLHSAFDAFVTSSGRSVAGLSEAQRNILVTEFLASRSGNAGTRAAAAAKPGPRVVLHIPDGSPAAATLSAHLLAALASKSSRMETRHVHATPSRPSIRYFRPEDAPAARLVATWMAGAGLAWTLQDFSTFQPRPSAGTIEVWLPSQP